MQYVVFVISNLPRLLLLLNFKNESIYLIILYIFYIYAISLSVKITPHFKVGIPEK